LRVYLTEIGCDLKTIPRTRKCDIRVVPCHGRTGPNKGLIRSQTLGPVNGRAVGVPKPDSAVFIGKLRHAKLRQAAGDLDMEGGVRRFATLDMGDCSSGAVMTASRSCRTRNRM